MSTFVRAAATSQVLSLAAMEEASRLGLREADLEHLFLALVISEQSAGQALRSLGIDLDAARAAVQAQHQAQLGTLGIEASLPAPGRIVFQETGGYTWSTRAADLITRSSRKGRAGDAAAVLRELVVEPSGLISDLLGLLGTTPDALLDQLDQLDRLDRLEVSGQTTQSTGPAVQGLASGSTQTFVPASVEEVWEFLASPARVPQWAVGVGSVDPAGPDAGPGAVWRAHADTSRPDGKPVKVKPQFRRRTIHLVDARRPERVAWRFAYPDAAQNPPVLTEFALRTATGGTHLTITTAWPRPRGWRGVVGVPLRPLQKFLVWTSLFQTASAISRSFR